MRSVMTKVSSVFSIACCLFVSSANAATIWNGDVIQFENPAGAGNVDVLTDAVHITRGSTAGIYNPVMEQGYLRGSSPGAIALSAPFEMAESATGAVSKTQRAR